jgi:hypothetical protein
MRDGSAVADVRPHWSGGPNWSGATVVIMASGPSLTVDDCERVRRWRADDDDRRAIAINTTFRVAPWADVVYACDARWWDVYAAEVGATCPDADRWTAELPARERHGVSHIPNFRCPGLYRRPGAINQGVNSGYQAIGLAYQFGAARIILLGYDMQQTGGKSHHHGDHPKGLVQALPYALWLQAFPALAKDLAAVGVSVVNATRTTALKAFPLVDLAKALA